MLSFFIKEETIRQFFPLRHCVGGLLLWKVKLCTLCLVFEAEFAQWQREVRKASAWTEDFSRPITLNHLDRFGMLRWFKFKSQRFFKAINLDQTGGAASTPKGCGRLSRGRTVWSINTLLNWLNPTCPRESQRKPGFERKSQTCEGQPAKHAGTIPRFCSSDYHMTV